MMNYQEYMDSQRWQSKREQYIAACNPTRCAGCLTPWGQDDHLHHTTYERLGHERLTDLMPLCQRCHTELHQSHMHGIDSLETTSRNYVRARREQRKVHHQAKPDPGQAGHGQSSFDKYVHAERNRRKTPNGRSNKPVDLRAQYLRNVAAAEERRRAMT